MSEGLKTAAAATANRVPRGAGMPQTLRAPALDRDARHFLAMFNLLAMRRPVSSYSIVSLRRRWRWLAMALGGGARIAEVTDRMVDGPAGGIQIRVFTPDGGARLKPALLWCPGGAFLVGDLDCADAMCRQMAHASGCVVVAARYRLAPEHDLYAGRDDALAVLRWIAREGATIGIDGARLAIGGDSAGGNIAAAVAQHCTRHRGPALRLQVLVYPATDLQHDHPSKAENASGYLLTVESIEWITRLIATTVDLGDPWLSPSREPCLDGLPPALLLSAGFDPIRDDGLLYAARLRAADVPVELLHYAGQFHGFLNFDALIGAAVDALQRVGQRLGETLLGGPVPDRTIEIADEAAAGGIAARAIAELGGASAMAWESIDRWSFTLLRLASTNAADIAHRLCGPWLAPSRKLRRALRVRIHRLRATSTYAAAKETR